MSSPVIVKDMKFITSRGGGGEEEERERGERRGGVISHNFS
jgi:hypothetical protein